MKQVKSVGAVVFSGSEFLLLKYGAGHWDFVKGHVEQGEEELETLQRELKEETGITGYEVIPGFREEISYFYKEKGELVKKTVVFYLVEARQKNVRLSFEHTEFVWLPFEKAVERLTYKNAKELLEKTGKHVVEKNG